MKATADPAIVTTRIEILVSMRTLASYGKNPTDSTL